MSVSRNIHAGSHGGVTGGGYGDGMMYLKIPLRYLDTRDGQVQGVEWWDRAVAGLLKSLSEDNHIEGWAASYQDLAKITPADLIWEPEPTVRDGGVR